MLFELMSDGTLAELPAEDMPEVSCGEKSVMLLLPHNKYLLGYGGEWVYAGFNPGGERRNISLYDGEGIELANDEALPPTILTAGTVRRIREGLMSVSDPPGNHTGAVLMLRTFMRDIYPEIFQTTGAEYLDEKFFAQALKNNPVLRKAYWTLRFAINRGEIEALSRIKAWIKAGPEYFSSFGTDMRLWFSIMEMPSVNDIGEMEALSFSRLELMRMSAQNASPVVVYNQVSGWLVLGRYGRKRDTMFFLWAYLNHDKWNVLREIKKLSVNDILLSLWCEYDIRQAMAERGKYKGGQ